MRNAIHHSGITTKNAARLVQFYIQHFGFETVVDTEMEGNGLVDAVMGLKNVKIHAFILKAANAFLEIFEFSNPVGKDTDPDRAVCDGGISHICIEVPDIEKAYAGLHASAVPLNCVPQSFPGFGKVFYGRDPDGNLVELIEVDTSGPLALAFASRASSI